MNLYICANNVGQVVPTEVTHAICNRSSMDIAGEIFSLGNSHWNVI